MQLCGDAHLCNFGVFASPERRLVFDLNDFDETLPGPFEWDVKRLAASLEVAGRDNGFRRRSAAEIAVARRARLPRPRCASSRSMTNLDVWYAHLDVEENVSAARRAARRAKVAQGAEASVAKARSGTACRRSGS